MTLYTIVFSVTRRTSNSSTRKGIHKSWIGVSARRVRDPSRETPRLLRGGTNYTFDAGQRQAALHQAQNMQITGAGLYRQDLRDLFGMTIAKMDAYKAARALASGRERAWCGEYSCFGTSACLQFTAIQQHLLSSRRSKLLEATRAEYWVALCVLDCVAQ